MTHIMNIENPAFYAVKSSDIVEMFPLLDQCFAFSYYELWEECLQNLDDFIYSEKRDTVDMEKYSTKQGINPVRFSLNEYWGVRIRISEGFHERRKSIANLLSDHPEAVRILIFMTAIFERDSNHLTATATTAAIRHAIEREKSQRPELLKLFLYMQQFRKGSRFYINCGRNSEKMVDVDGWFSTLITKYLKKRLGDITPEEALDELQTIYPTYRGKQAQDPLRNRFMLGCWNVIDRLVLPGQGIVTTEQCKLLQALLRVVGLLKEGDADERVDTLRSRIADFRKSDTDILQRHRTELRKKALLLDRSDASELPIPECFRFGLSLD